MNKENLEQILSMQEENYKDRIGVMFGIFKVDNVEYNWVTRTQEWTVLCTKCGHKETVPGSVGRDWMRGKGRSRMKCPNCFVSKGEIKKQEREMALDSLLCTENNGWLVSGRNNRVFTVVCQECGKEKTVSDVTLKTGVLPKCQHRKDFSKPEYIGKRYGNLTVLEHVGGSFRVRCDCGFEKLVKCSSLENKKSTTCGRLECDYHIKELDYLGKHGELVRAKGEKSEKEVQKWLERLGYVVERTPSSGDYGVDLLVVGRDGKRVAIQIKNNASTKSETNVRAVQEVFAGGHYYDCDKFAVVSYTGYTENARKMADKLGVMLLTERCELAKPEEHFPVNTKWLWSVNGKIEPMVETFRREGWGDNISRYCGMTYEEVKSERMRIAEKEKRVSLINQSNISHQTVAYRMKHMGMTLEQAISTPTNRKKRGETVAM